jgi:hypothetical protein
MTCQQRVAAQYNSLRNVFVIWKETRDLEHFTEIHPNIKKEYICLLMGSLEQDLYLAIFWALVPFEDGGLAHDSSVFLLSIFSASQIREINHLFLFTAVLSKIIQNSHSILLQSNQVMCPFLAQLLRILDADIGRVPTPHLIRRDCHHRACFRQ